uniref:Inositol-pentakisphosphate 2-kinase n=1 Tax=Mycena chlorophos TaxID=658473 RepID=A0ABQ0LGD1_MYCCL|nr:predicted protein [Mycena chlorophos]
MQDLEPYGFSTQTAQTFPSVRFVAAPAVGVVEEKDEDAPDTSLDMSTSTYGTSGNASASGTASAPRTRASPTPNRAPLALVLVLRKRLPKLGKRLLHDADIETAALTLLIQPSRACPSACHVAWRKNVDLNPLLVRKYKSARLRAVFMLRNWKGLSTLVAARLRHVSRETEEMHPDIMKTSTCRFCMHSHFRGLETAYCLLDLHFGEEDRMRRALEALGDGWERSGGDRKRLPPRQQTLLLRTLSHLQRTLDALDVEGLATTPGPSRRHTNRSPSSQPSFQGHPERSQSAFDTILLSAKFKDCSLIVRISEGTAKLIDLDVKSITGLRKWEQKNGEIVEAYMKVLVMERKRCVDALRGRD